jgi:hypothetical protein
VLINDWKVNKDLAAQPPRMLVTGFEREKNEIGLILIIYDRFIIDGA